MPVTLNLLHCTLKEKSPPLFAGFRLIFMFSSLCFVSRALQDAQDDV